MRIVDLDLKEAMQDLSVEALEKIENNLHGDVYDLCGKWTSYEDPRIYTSALKKVIEQYRKSEGLSEFEGLDDKKEHEKIEDANERFKADNSVERSMPDYDVKKQARQMATLKRGGVYTQEFSGKSLEELEEESHDLSDSFWGASGEKKSVKDPVYGLDFYEKKRVLGYLINKARVREAVARIPAKELSLRKEKFEEARQYPKCLYPNDFNEIEAIYSLVFGDELAPDLESSTIVDIGEAFEEREKELQASKKVGLFAKLKNFFTRRNQKRLPVLTTVEEKNVNERNTEKDFRRNIRVTSNGQQLNNRQVPSKGKGRDEEYGER